MAPAGSKRKRSSDVKQAMVAQLYHLNNDSFNLTEGVIAAKEDFMQMFKSIGERQSEIYARSVGVDEQYEHILALLKGDIPVQPGESSTTPNTMPLSYTTDAAKFFNDSSLSLDDHSKSFVQRVDEMIKEIDEQGTIWKGKLMEMKKQAEHLVSQRTKLGAELSEFTKSN